jgi:hypothetical protein
MKLTFYRFARDSDPCVFSDMPFISQTLSSSGEHNSKKIKTMAQAASVFMRTQIVAANSRGVSLKE